MYINNNNKKNKSKAPIKYSRQNWEKQKLFFLVSLNPTGHSFSSPSSGLRFWSEQTGRCLTHIPDGSLWTAARRRPCTWKPEGLEQDLSSLDTLNHVTDASRRLPASAHVFLRLAHLLTGLLPYSKRPFYARLLTPSANIPSVITRVNPSVWAALTGQLGRTRTAEMNGWREGTDGTSMCSKYSEYLGGRRRYSVRNVKTTQSNGGAVNATRRKTTVFGKRATWKPPREARANFTSATSIAPAGRKRQRERHDVLKFKAIFLL